MPSLVSDLRYGLRLFRKNPGFCLVAALTLAIGIGATTTVFSWINGILLHPYPGVEDPGRLVALETLAPSGEHVTTSYPDFRDFRDNIKLLEGIALAQPRPLNLGDETHAQRVWAEMVSGNFFDVLRVRPAAGRFFSGAEKDDAQGAHPVAVISYSLWQSRFQADPRIIGTSVRVNRYPFTVIGVAPKGFNGSMAGIAFEMWLPATMFGQVTSTGTWMLRDRKTRMFRSIARLGPGVTLEQARDELKSLALRMAEANAYTNHGISATVVPMSQSSFGAERVLSAPLGILMAVCSVVLLIVCANVANLLLARATSRNKEFSIRVALGAGRVRLVRQLLTETLLIATAGSLLALAMLAWTGGAIKMLLPPNTIPTLADPPLDPRVLLFTAALTIGVAVFAGLAPALHSARSDVYDSLKEGGRSGTAGARSNGLRRALVMSEVGLAVVALAGAGLFLKSFALSKTINPGFDPNHVVVAAMDLTTANYGPEQAESYCARLRERLRSLPGVQAVTYADTIPLGFSAGSWEDLEIQGYTPGPSENMKIYRNLVAPGYFDTMRIPLLEGRDFTVQDDVKSQRVMIVNQEFLRRFLPSRNPIGQKVRGWGQWFSVIGVVRDSKYHTVTENPMPYFYVPIRQVFRPEMGLNFYVRTSAPLDDAIAALRREARATDPNVAVFEAMPLAEFIGGSLFGQKVAATLLSVLAGIAVLLAAIGLYGVLAYSISERTREIGIRMALGAQPRSLLRMILKEALLLTAGGLAAGVAVAIVLARAVSRTLVSVSPYDAQVYASVAAFLIATAVIAGSLPALRTMRTDPIEALRSE